MKDYVQKIEAYEYAGKKFFELKDARKYRKIYQDFKSLESITDSAEAMTQFRELLIKHFPYLKPYLGNGIEYKEKRKMLYFGALHKLLMNYNFKDKCPIVFEMYDKLVNVYIKKYGYSRDELQQLFVNNGMEDRRGICGF